MQLSYAIILIKNNNKFQKNFLNIIKKFLYYICKLNNLNIKNYGYHNKIQSRDV